MAIRAAARRVHDREQLSAVFGALADPTRRAMLERLATGARTVSDLNAPFAVSQPTISKHLKVLERAGLVERGRDSRWRPRTLRAAPLAQASEYLEKFRALWDARLDRMEAYVRVLKGRRRP